MKNRGPTGDFGRDSTRYQVRVVGHDVGELVDLAGGWICDRTLAGWDVSVALAEPGDRRPLQILGVTTFIPPQELLSMNDGPVTASVGMTAGIYENDFHVRGEVLRALDQEAVEVTFWGRSIPSELAGRLRRRQHRLSGAAGAFKAHALAAASLSCATIYVTEDLYSSKRSYDVSLKDETHRRAAGQQQN